MYTFIYAWVYYSFAYILLGLSLLIFPAIMNGIFENIFIFLHILFIGV